MNLINRFKYAMGLVPRLPKIEFEDKFCLLSPTKPHAILSLEDKIKVGHNAAIFRFNFKNNDVILGTKIGQFVNLTINAKDETSQALIKLTRPYVPISSIDEMGIADFLVRIYKADEKTQFQGGAFTKYLDQMRVNDTIEVSGPFTTYIYNGLGSFDLKYGDNIKSVSGIKYLGLIVSGNGITAFFQMLEAIARSRIDHTNVSVLYINKEYKDMLMLEELMSFHEQNKIRLNLLVEEPEAYWPGLRGDISKELLEDSLPPPGPETLIMACLASSKKEQCKQILKGLGHKEDAVYII